MITFNHTQFNQEISDRIDASARDIGQKVVAQAKINASRRPGPEIRSGRLQRGISYTYNNQTHEIAFILEAPYAAFVEYGTRRMDSYAFLRPALNSIATVFGFETSFNFQNTIKTDKELLVGGSRYISGKGLTAGQKRHVKYNLKPKMLRHHIGNVSRAKVKF